MADSIWQRIANLFGSFSDRTGLAGSVGTMLDPDTWLPGGKDAAFTLALVALSAKMAVSDGVVTQHEVTAFRRTVHIPEGSEEQIMRLFELAEQDVAGYRSYAKKIARLFADSPDTLEHVLDGLFQIASSDGLIHEAELAYLESVSRIFGFDEARFDKIVMQHVFSDERQDPYLALGLSSEANDEEVRRLYRRLVREHHPDRLHAKGVPTELMDMATARMAAINHAYDRIARLRGFKGGANEDA